MEGLFVKSGYNNVFYSNSRNMARFGLFVLAKGKWDGKAILNNESYINAMSQSSQQLNKSYGYLWWLNGKDSYMLPGLQAVIPGSLIPSAPATMFSALGKNDQKIHICPEQNIVVIRMGENPEGDDVNVPVIFDRALWEKLSDIMNITTSTADNFTISRDKVVTNAGDELLINEDIQVNKFLLSQRDGIQFNCSFVDNKIDISQLKRGLYFIRIEDKRKKIYINKFFKY
jgi:CubicO group peptidase (beta-lactamase class C family)